MVSIPTPAGFSGIYPTEIFRETEYGKGSSKNERKANEKRVAVNRAAITQLRLDIRELKTRSLTERSPNHEHLLSVAQGRLKRALARIQRSPNDTQSGKRGGR